MRPLMNGTGPVCPWSSKDEEEPKQVMPKAGSELPRCTKLLKKGPKSKQTGSEANGGGSV